MKLFALALILTMAAFIWRYRPDDGSELRQMQRDAATQRLIRMDFLAIPGTENDPDDDQIATFQLFRPDIRPGTAWTTDCDPDTLLCYDDFLEAK